MPRSSPRLFLYRLLARVPLPLLYRLADLVIFPLLYFVVRYRRRTVADNLAHAFPDLSATQRLDLERAYYHHISDVLVEVFAAWSFEAEQLEQRVVLENPEVLQPYFERKQSLLLLSIHQGNWEWLLRRVGDFLPCPMDGIYKPLHDAAMDRFIHEVRGASINPIPFQKAGREMLRRRREFRAFAMLADQAPFKRDPRHWQMFLNRSASFYLGPQKLAEATQCPAIYVAMKKVTRGEYRVRFELLAEPPFPDGEFAILDRYIDACQRAILDQPETWLWSNRKWKHKPPAEIGLETEPNSAH